ncbi:MAG TPA: hypothetical protein VMF87_15635 [Streptosporangiaceae bacterium]|nr:hypothetical protein [Streptosporangiaceae bacterium]
MLAEVEGLGRLGRLREDLDGFRGRLAVDLVVVFATQPVKHVNHRLIAADAG